MEFYEEWLENTESLSKDKNRPLINLCFAQSIDGSVAAKPGKKLALSGEESSILTHKLRAVHDAILVGVGTILSDNPLLTVRLVKGRNPQPVIIDSLLKTPAYSRLLNENPIQAWFMTTARAPANRIEELQSLGARVEILPSDKSGWIILPSALKRLSNLGIRSVMVEGGARIISSFLSQQLVDHLVLTIAMVVVGGFHIPALHNTFDDPFQSISAYPRLFNCGYKWLADDLIVWGDFEYTGSA